MALRADTIREFGELFVRDEPPRAQTHRAVVTAVDGGTVYVDVSGNGDATPIETTSAGYAIGDEVQVEQRGGRLHVSGNVTQPSVGAQHVEQAVAPVARTAAQAQSASQSAQRAASEAQAVADATAQHFFDDTDGIHVTEAEQDTWTTTHTGKNILINSLGILLRNALNNLVSITASAIAFFDGSGNAASNVVAQFGASGAQIGKSGESHMELDYHSLQLVDKEGDTYFQVSDLRDEQGYLTETFEGDGTTTEFHAILNISSVDYIKINGTATSSYSVMGRVITFASAPANGSTIEIRYMPTTAEAKAYTFGRRASGTVGAYSVAEGSYTTASGLDSHAEGDVTTASGEASHAEGYNTTASGYCSHAQNNGTIAASANQTAIGKFNDNDPNNAFEIGNGTDVNARSNAFAVDWDGYIYPCAEKMPDFVVEQGTSGIWTYRKWHSGVAECWGTYSASIAITSSSASYGGYRSGLITASAFPSGLFNAAPMVTGTSMTSGGNWLTNTNGTTSTNVKFYLSCGTSSAAATRDIAFHCSGRWK